MDQSDTSFRSFAVLTLQDFGDLATDFSVAKSKKSVSKSFSDGFATEKNSVGKTLVAKNLATDCKFPSLSLATEIRIPR